MLADPRLRLPDVAAEVARLAGGGAADEASVRAALGRMLARSDPAFKVSTMATLPCLAAPVLSRVGGVCTQLDAV